MLCYNAQYMVRYEYSILYMNTLTLTRVYVCLYPNNDEIQTKDLFQVFAIHFGENWVLSPKT